MTQVLSAFNTISGRSCCICGKELTDAVSMELSLGPICRSKANEILAKEVPIQLTGDVMLHFMALTTEELPEVCRPTYLEISKTMEQALNSTSDSAGFDHRKAIKQIEWILSHPISNGARTALISFVEGLGYRGLASLLRGEASTGKAKVYVRDGRIHLEGPRNKAGRVAFKEQIKAWRFHEKDDVRNLPVTWSAPLNQVDNLISVVSAYWPLAEGLDTIKDEAGKAVASQPAPTINIVPMRGRWINGLGILAPFNMDLINGIKALEWKSREYVPQAKAWVIKKEQLDTVKSLLAKHFPSSPVNVAQ